MPGNTVSVIYSSYQDTCSLLQPSRHVNSLLYLWRRVSPHTLPATNNYVIFVFFWEGEAGKACKHWQMVLEPRYLCVCTHLRWSIEIMRCAMSGRALISDYIIARTETIFYYHGHVRRIFVPFIWETQANWEILLCGGFWLSLHHTCYSFAFVFTSSPIVFCGTLEFWIFTFDQTWSLYSQKSTWLCVAARFLFQNHPPRVWSTDAVWRHWWRPDSRTDTPVLARHMTTTRDDTVQCYLNWLFFYARWHIV